MIWFAIIAAAVLAAALVSWTIATANRMSNPFAWKAAATAIVTIGLIPGFWIGFGLRYAASESIEFQGFPIPLVTFILEEGRWVDYVGNLPLGALNVFYLDSILLAPLSLAMLVVRWPCRKSAVETPRTME